LGHSVVIAVVVTRTVTVTIDDRRQVRLKHDSKNPPRTFFSSLQQTFYQYPPWETCNNLTRHAAKNF